MMGYLGYGYDHAGYGLLGSFIMVIFWIIVIFLIIFMVRRIKVHEHLWKEKSALDILKTRYAKGEIDKREYEEKKKDIEE